MNFESCNRIQMANVVLIARRIGQIEQNVPNGQKLTVMHKMWWSMQPLRNPAEIVRPGMETPQTGHTSSGRAERRRIGGAQRAKNPPNAGKKFGKRLQNAREYV